MFRDPNKDQLKSPTEIKKARKTTCVCGKRTVTLYQGPGDQSLCRTCQKNLVEYGGMGKLARPHTFHRSDVCACCKQNINDDARWESAQTFFGITLDEKQISEVKRRYSHGDHIVRKADGGDDSAENTAALCSFCHWVKTAAFNDGRRGTLLEG